MGYGLIDLGANTRKQALAGMEASSARETARDNANKQLKSAEKSQTMSAVGTGAGFGTMITPGIGTVAGAAVGFLASKFF
jgi:cytochrome c biogenesis protein CcdA